MSHLFNLIVTTCHSFKTRWYFVNFFYVLLGFVIVDQPSQIEKHAEQLTRRLKNKVETKNGRQIALGIHDVTDLMGADTYF